MQLLLKSTQAIFLTGLVLLSIIAFINLFILLSSYTGSFITDSSLYFTESYNYFFNSKEGLDYMMAVYLGFCAGYVINNIIDYDEYTSKQYFKLILIFLLTILISDLYNDFNEVCLTCSALLARYPCNCKKCSCGFGDCDCTLPSQCQDLHCTDKDLK